MQLIVWYIMTSGHKQIIAPKNMKNSHRECLFISFNHGIGFFQIYKALTYILVVFLYKNSL